MPLSATASLLDALRAHQLLRPAQMDELVRDGTERFAEARALAQNLLERGWLTPYQVNQLLMERGAELLLGPYLLIERLGEGFGGTVFKAHHQRMNRDVALRVVRKELLDNPEAIQQFYAQVESASKLDHDNVVHAYDAGPIGETHFLATEYIAGIDLAKLVQQSGRLQVSQACTYIYQAALGLQHGFAYGLVHRGLKPSKLMVSQPHGAGSVNVVKVLDIGLTRLLRVPGAEPRPIGRADAACAAHYQAPEQADGTADIRGDLYSLGCIFSYLLTAQPPAAAGAIAPPLEQLRSDVPAAVSAIVQRMTAAAPADRYPTPAEVAQELQAFASVGEPSGDDWNASDRTPFAVGSTVNLLPADGRPRVRSSYAEGLRWVLFVALGGVLLIAGFLVCQALLLSEPGTRKLTTEPPAPKPSDWLDPALVSAGEREIAGPQPDLVGVVRLGTSAVRAVSFHPKATYLAAGSDDGTIHFCEWNTGHRLSWDGHPKGVRALAFAADGQTLASGGKDKKVKLWDVASRREKQSWTTQTDQVSFLAFTPDGQQLAGRFASREVRMVDLGSGKDRHFLKAGTKVVSTIAISPEGKTLVIGLQEKSLIFFDLPGNKRTNTVDAHATAVRALAYSPDGKTLASAGDDKLVKLWDPAANNERAALTGHKAGVVAMSFAPDSQTLASAALDGHVILWRITEKVTIGEWHFPVGVDDLAISPDGRYLAVASANGAIYILRLPAATGEENR